LKSGSDDASRVKKRRQNSQSIIRVFTSINVELELTPRDVGLATNLLRCDQREKVDCFRTGAFMLDDINTAKSNDTFLRLVKRNQRALRLLEVRLINNEFQLQEPKIDDRKRRKENNRA